MRAMKRNWRTSFFTSINTLRWRNLNRVDENYNDNDVPSEFDDAKLWWRTPYEDIRNNIAYIDTFELKWELKNQLLSKNASTCDGRS